MGVKENSPSQSELPCLWNLIPKAPKLTNLNIDYGRIAKESNPVLEDFGSPHIKSFDWMAEEGLKNVLNNLTPMQFELPSHDRITFKITDCRLCTPQVVPGASGVKEMKVFPTECRQRYTSYKGNFYITLSWWLNGIQQASIEKNMGAMPIMVKSKLCNLYGLKPKGLVMRGEHETEFGGYFIAKGHEKLIRMLLMNRSNYPMYLIRSAWLARGRGFTNKGVLIRCVSEDRTSQNNVIHYLNDGSMRLMFNVGRELFFVPILMVLKALVDVTDEYIYKQCIAGFEDDLFFETFIQDMLRQMHKDGLHFNHQVKVFIGERFRSRVAKTIGEWKTDAECCEYLLKKGVCIQCTTPMEKFHFLIYSMQKLYCGVNGKAIPESADHVMAQEVLLGGHLYLTLIKDKLINWLDTMKFLTIKKAKSNPASRLGNTDVTNIVNSTFQIDRNFDAFIATGNVPLDTGRGLPQTSGLTIIVENLNRLRYLAHFRSVHRGAFFQELRTTDARQLQPDAWGFICPVHTPDGSPCGLLNHLSAHCHIVSETQDSSKISSVLVGLGMSPIDKECPYPIKDCFKVLLDGKVLGYIWEKDAILITNKLREMKIKDERVPKLMEIALVPKIPGGHYPGLYLFASLARMMRPVMNLKHNAIEWIGTFEQLYLHICIILEEAHPGLTTHQEVNERMFISHLASLIPMPDCNQSPRNMYQCQMGKQTMGTPWHTYHRLAENKLYRLYFPGTPFFRPVHYDYLNLDEYPMGTNAIVAVISYTGYDMEDAMIINKSSFERGFGHGCIYKSEHVDLKFLLQNPHTNSTFMRDPTDPKLEKTLDQDGLPYIGGAIDKDDPIYCYYNTETGTYTVKKFSGAERAYIDSVKLKGNDAGTLEKSSVVIVFRLPKNPRMGDKFASRSGQKGICSYLWPTADLPWTETGIVPDIVFNPHGFPSRMTIAMMYEVMAGKSAALHGIVHDASPFKFNEEDTASEYFGKLLEKGGYDFYGTERLYSGTDGRELTADIFIGIVHYQRLRHMVSEKWQVRATGPLDSVTHQPNKGRRRGGGVRFGEMEKDCLLSHGAAYLLQDRLFHGSDRSTTFACTRCSSIVCSFIKIPEMLPGETLTEKPRPKCYFCDSDEKVEIIEIPYIFKLLVDQLASVNIHLKVKVGHV